MTSEEARAVFNEALDDELDQETQRAFELALAQDGQLAEEFQRLRQVVQGASALSQAVPSVDLLGSVQEKLRVRSGGRFYRDRFAEKQGRSAMMSWVLLGSVLLVLAVAVWLGFESGFWPR